MSNASVHLFVNSTLHDEPNVPYYTNPPQNGSLYYVTPAGAGPIDCTPTVYGDNFYTWGVNAVYPDLNNDPSFSDYPHILTIMANGQPLNSQPIPDFCVGQFLTFVLDGLPSSVGTTAFYWTFGGHYFNNGSNSVPDSPDCSTAYYVDPSLLTIQNPAPLWWVSGGPNAYTPATYNASVQFTLSFPNGQPAIQLESSGLFNMWRPTAKINPVTTSVNVAVLDDLYLIFGGYGFYGITFYHTVNCPAKFQGNIDWTQTISSTTNIYMDRTGQETIQIQTGSAPYLDTTDPYGAKEGNNPVDAPSIVLDPPHIIMAEATTSRAFEMTMMFEPLGGGMRVPLRAVDWSFAGTATNSFDSNKGVLGWLKKDGSGSADPDFETENYPVWQSNVSDYTWRPPFP